MKPLECVDYPPQAIHHWQSQLGESSPCLVASNADSHLPASDAGVLWFLHKHSNSSIWNELSFPTTHTVPDKLFMDWEAWLVQVSVAAGQHPKEGQTIKFSIATQGVLHGGFSLLQLLNHTGTYGFTCVLYESTPRPIPSPVLLRVDNLKTYKLWCKAPSWYPFGPLYTNQCSFHHLLQ